MKIAFVYPALPFDKEHHLEALPIGLLYLTAVVEARYGSCVDIFDSRHGPAIPGPDALNRYDLIGFTAMSMQINRALTLARRIRDGGFRGKLVFGGPHASVATDHLKRYPFIDAIFLGEAEESFLAYVDRLTGEPATLRRTWIRDDDGTWRFHEGDEYICDLDTLPIPSRDKYASLVRASGMINMTTTRGCPFKCNYCQPTKEILFGKRVRRRSVDNIIAEIEDAVRRYGIHQFSIDDDTFTFNRRVVLEFCSKVKQLGFSWSCQSRSDIDRQTLEAMADAGCNLIYVGAESGSQRILDRMNKKNTVETNTAFIRNCNEVGIRTWCNIMVGYPGETREDMEKSLAFVRKSRPSRVCVSQVTPFPGTHLWTTYQDDIIHRNWDDIARHVQKPKFKSQKKNQWLISYYTIIMSKDFGKPLNDDLIRSNRLLWAIRYLLPLTFRFPSAVRLLKRIRNRLFVSG